MNNLIETKTPVLQVEYFVDSFDIIPVANSLLKIIGDLAQARIIQQLHYLLTQEYGAVLEGRRWIYRTIEDWHKKVLPSESFWKTRKALNRLEARNLIVRKKLHFDHQQQYKNPWWKPENQTYYYSLNYDALEELARDVINASSVLCDSTKLSDEETATSKDCEYPQDNTEIKSTKNLDPISLEREKIKKKSNSDRENTREEKVNTGVLKDTAPHMEYALATGVFPPVIIPEAPKVDPNSKSVPSTNGKSNDFREVEQKINKNRKKAPWRDRNELKRFHAALIEALPKIANSHSAEALAQKIIRDLASGGVNSYWDDFVNGNLIGSSTKADWEVVPGEPYPIFVNYLIETLREGNNTTSAEQHLLTALKILNRPKQAQVFWQKFQQSLVRIAENAQNDTRLGINSPNLPVWSRQVKEPSFSEVIEAGNLIDFFNRQQQSLISFNQNRLSSSSEENLTSLINSDLLVDNLSIAEINQLLKEPVLRKKIVSQLWNHPTLRVKAEIGGKFTVIKK